MKKGLSEIIILYDDNILCNFEQKKVLGACKSMLRDLKTEDNEVNITFLKYSDTIEFIAENRAVLSLSFKNINPIRSGACALIDCTAEAIIKIGERYAQQPFEEHPENVIFLLTVCGQENASKSYTYQQLNDMIFHQTDVYKWSFFMLTDKTINFENLAIGNDNTVLFDSDDFVSLKIATEKLGQLISARIKTI